MITMTSKCPTVMERPYYLYVRLVEILEQDAIIQKVIVNVMQLHHIGLYHVEQTLVVGYHDCGCFGRVHLVHAVGDDAHGIDIESGVGLIENGEPRPSISSNRL